MAAIHLNEAQFADYETDFDPRAFLEEFYDPINLKTPIGLLVQRLNHLYDMIDTNIEEKSLQSALDFGCGPSIIGSLCASRKISNIVCADLVDRNRNAIARWLNDDVGIFDWSSHIKYLCEKEGIDPSVLVERTRSSIKDIIPCDAQADQPLGQNPPFSPYDVILAISVLQEACSNKDMFTRAIKKLCHYLKPEGLFIMGSVMDASCHSFGGDPPKTFRKLSVNEEDIREILQSADMTVVSLSVFKGNIYKEDPDQPDGIDCPMDTYTYYMVFSRKIAE